MKVIFLDIDGVLNYTNFWYKRRLEFEKTGKFGPNFDEEKIKLLSEIVSETGAKIVLSSTWRGGFVKDNNKGKLVSKPGFEDCIELNLAFEKYNLEMYDRTTGKGHIRQEQIKEWLANNEVDSFVVIDDDMFDLTDFIGKELVKTNNSGDGLNESHKDIIISKLNKEKVIVKKSLEQILLEEDVVKSIKDNFNYLIELIPELKDMIYFPHNHPHHHLDVWNHTLCALNFSRPDFDLRLCLLLHDIGKPHSYQDNEIRTFKGHAEKSSIITNDILTRFNYEKDYINQIRCLVENHDNPINRKQIINNYELCLKRYLIQYCDALAHNPNKLEKRIVYLKYVLNLLIEENKKTEERVKSKIKYNI